MATGFTAYTAGGKGGGEGGCTAGGGGGGLCAGGAPGAGLGGEDSSHVGSIGAVNGHKTLFPLQIVSSVHVSALAVESHTLPSEAGMATSWHVPRAAKKSLTHLYVPQTK